MLPCTGGMSENQALTTFPLALGRVGVITEKTAGVVLNHSTSVQGEIHIANIDLLNHAILIDALDTQAQASWGKTIAHTASTTLVHARILGQDVNIPVGPNIRISLGNIGYIVFNEQVQVVNGSQVSVGVNALDVYITTANVLHLPIGAVITLGHVDLGVHSLK
jgi:hypothetical protein